MFCRNRANIFTGSKMLLEEAHSLAAVLMGQAVNPVFIKPWSCSISKGSS